jgi:capsule polysaccharide export protein KpsE/RkpR
MVEAMTGKDFSIEEPAEVIDETPLSVVSSDSYEVSLIDVLTQLAYRKWLIAKVTGIAVLTGVILCFVLPVRYTATTRIMPPQQTPSTASMLMMNQLTNMGGGSSLAALAGGGLGLRNPNDIYIGLLNSRPVADAIIQKFDLAKVYNARDMTQARKELADSTKVNSERNGFIAVSVTDKDKSRVAEMANAYTDQLRILTKSLAVTEASQRRLFYEEQLKQAKEALVAAELAFQQVQQQKGLVQLDAQAKAMIESLTSVRAQVAAKQVEVQALRSYSTEQNPDLQLAEKELTSLQAEESRLEQSNHAPGIAGLGLGNVPAAGLEYLRASHELQYQQALFDMLMKQYDAAKLDESKDAAVIQVVEPAIEPDQKSSPKRLAILLRSTFIGLLFGLVLAQILNRMERNLSDSEAARALWRLKCALTGQKSSEALSQPVGKFDSR